MTLPWPFNRRTKVYKTRRTPNEWEYRRQYRFDESSVVWMAGQFLGTESGETRGGALTNKKKMEQCLAYMSDPGFMSRVGEVAGVSQPTISRTVSYVVDEVCKQKDVWIKFPSSRNEFDDLALVWSGKKNLPGCFGAVDGSLVKVQVPPARYIPQDYYTGRKKIYCINTMVVCSADERFIHADVRWPGKAHDARVCRNSAVETVMSTGVSGNRYLIEEIRRIRSVHI